MALPKLHQGKGVFAATALAQVMSGDMGGLTLAIGKPSYNPHTNTLYLPGIPGDDLPEEALRLLRAYLAHEAAERGRSSWDPADPRWWHNDPSKRKPGLKKLVNAINDARIDLSYQHDYPGAYMNIRWSVERDIAELLRKNKEQPLEPSVNIVATLTRYIGEGLMTVDDIYREFPQLEKHVRKVDHILRNLDLSTEDAIVAQAEEIYATLKKPDEPPKEAAPLTAALPPMPELPEPEPDEEEAETESQAQQQKAKEQGDSPETDYQGESPEADEKGEKGQSSGQGGGDGQDDPEEEEGEAGESGEPQQGGGKPGEGNDDSEQHDPLPGEDDSNVPQAPQSGGSDEEGEEDEADTDHDTDGAAGGQGDGGDEGEDDEEDEDGEWDDDGEDADDDEWDEDDYEDAGADQGRGQGKADDEDGLDEFNEEEGESSGSDGGEDSGQGDSVEGEDEDDGSYNPQPSPSNPNSNGNRKTPDEQPQVDESTPDLPPALEDEADTDHDTDKAMLDDIVKQMFGDDEAEGDSNPWSMKGHTKYTWDPTHDEVKVVPHKSGYPWDPAQYNAAAQVLETKLRQALTMPAPRMSRGRERGEVDERALVKVPMGQTSVFKRRVVQESDSVAASLSWDESSSMSSGVPLVTLLAYTFNKALGGLGVSTEMLGWTTIGRQYNPDVYRQSTIRHRVYKEFKERHTDEKVLRRLSRINTPGITPTAEGLRFALERLAARPEKRKVLFFLTDGQPYMDVSGDSEVHERYIHTLVQRAEAAGIEIVGVGIGADLSHHFPRFIVVTDINELRGTVSDTLIKVLREGKRKLIGGAK